MAIPIMPVPSPIKTVMREISFHWPIKIENAIIRRPGCLSVLDRFEVQIVSTARSNPKNRQFHRGFARSVGRVLNLSLSRELLRRERADRQNRRGQIDSETRSDEEDSEHVDDEEATNHDETDSDNIYDDQIRIDEWTFKENQTALSDLHGSLIKSRHKLVEEVAERSRFFSKHHML
jgi:hypothetical protein